MLGLAALFSSLVGPVMVVAGLLGFVAVTNQQEVDIATLTLPHHVVEDGYTEFVVGERLRGRLHALERSAKTSAEGRSIETETNTGSITALGTYLGIQPLIRALQVDLRLNEFNVEGDIVTLEKLVANDGNLLMRLRIHQRDGMHVMATSHRPRTEMEQMLQEAAEAILYVVNPQIYCAAVLRTALQPSLNRAVPVMTANLSEELQLAQTCIGDAIKWALPADRIWLYNLMGVTLFLRGDQAGSLAAFRAALKLDPNFSPALLNIGVQFAVAGRHEDAIRFYQRVFRRDTIREAPQTHAAALTKWADSLMVLGRADEARLNYAAAVRRDAKFAPAYARWAASLPPGPEADRLNRLANRANGEMEPLYTGNLVGPVLRLAAPPPAPSASPR